jgi:hypothetical protein
LVPTHLQPQPPPCSIPIIQTIHMGRLTRSPAR